MTTVQDLFIDSESTGSYNDFTIYLPHPVIVEDDEKAYICLKDFQALNSFYNISNDLQNNTLVLKQNTRTYARTPAGDTVAYIDNTELFNTSGTNINKPKNNPIHDGALHTETLEPDNDDYSIRLYDITIGVSNPSVPLSTAKLSNIFRPTIGTNTMSFMPNDYLVFFNYNEPTTQRYVNSLTFSIVNDTPLFPPTSAVYVALKVWSSIDGITWIANGFTGTNAIGYATNEWLVSTTKTLTFTLISGDDYPTDTYSYHKVSFDLVGLDGEFDFKNRISFKQIHLTRKTSFDETFTTGVVNTNYTIEDGAYSLTNLNSYLNYLLKTNLSQYISFTTTYASQPFLTAQNKHILNWSSVEPPFIYTPANKTNLKYSVEVIFNTTLKKMLGWVSSNLLVSIGTSIEALSYINLINFKKIVIASSLQLTTKPYTFLNKTYTKATGIGDIFAWIPKDIAAFSYINWQNPTDSRIEIDNKLITKINFKITNEYLQVLNEVPPCNFHLQIIKIKEK
jgi:hypothetical protein